MKRIALTVALLATAAAGYRFRSEAGNAMQDYLWRPDGDSLATLQLKKADYQVEVVASGELTGFQTTSAVTPVVRGSLKIAWMIDEGTLVKAGQPLVRFDNTDAQLSLEQNQNQVDTFQQRMRTTELTSESELDALKIDGQTADLELHYSRNQIRQDEDIFSRWEIQESIVSAALAEFKMSTLKEKGQYREDLSEADLRILGIDRRKAQTEVDQAQKTLAALELVAPTDGVVLYRRNTFNRIEVGGDAWPGQALLDIADTGRFEGTLRVVENDIGGVEPGKPVICTLQAFPGRAYSGTVRSVAAVAQQLNRKDPRKYFECRVSLDVSAEDLLRLRPGMNLAGRIVAGRWEDAFVVPKNAVFKEDERFVVFSAVDGGYQKTPVNVLMSDHGFYVIDGVADGMRVSLQHPYEKDRLRLPDFNAPSAASRGRRFVAY